MTRSLEDAPLHDMGEDAVDREEYLRYVAEQKQIDKDRERILGAYAVD